MARWHGLGPVEQFTRPVTPVAAGQARLSVTRLNGRHGEISGVRNHAGGPLSEGHCEGEYLAWQWHGWKYHLPTGRGAPGFDAGAPPTDETRLERGRHLVDLDPATPRTRGHHPPHPPALDKPGLGDAPEPS